MLLVTAATSVRFRTAGDLGLVERDLAEVVQQRRHLEVVEVVRSRAEPVAHRDRQRGDPLGVPGGTSPPSSGAIASDSIVWRYASVAESSRSNAYHAASNGVAKSSGPQMPTSPLPSTPR